MKKCKKIGILSMLSLSVLQLIQSCCTPHQGLAGDHFNGLCFQNPDGAPEHSWLMTLKWLWEMKTVQWPNWIEDPEQPRPPARVGQGKIRITYINHATVLIQIDEVNILTDPIWSYRAGPVSWLGARRVRSPGVPLKDLPEIDLILISHDHYDHLDRATMVWLAKRDRPRILVGLGIRNILKQWGIQGVRELDWWQSYNHYWKGLSIVFVPARHNSGRGFFCRNNTLWGGFVIQARTGNIYFAGDTAYGEFLLTIRRRFPKIILAILPIGSYEKRWFMKNQHMNPEDAVRAHLVLRARQSMGIHYATFLEHPEQTIDAHERDLSEMLRKYHFFASVFRVLKFGEGMFVHSPENTRHAGKTKSKR